MRKEKVFHLFEEQTRQKVYFCKCLAKNNEQKIYKENLIINISSLVPEGNGKGENNSVLLCRIFKKWWKRKN